MTNEAKPDPPKLTPAPEADVAAFVATHGTQYDAATDAYQCDPLVVHGRHGKASATYNVHAYHTKVPPDAIKPYIEHYTSPGDLVLDPFCGSGMTGVSALLTGRNVVLSDLSPAAVHIAYNYCTPIDVAALKPAWASLKSAVADEFAWLYGTTCDHCGGPATIQSSVWSDVVGCPKCGADVVLWDVAVVREGTPGKYDPPLSGLTTCADWQPPTASTAPAKGTSDGHTTTRTGGDVLDAFTCPKCGWSDLKKSGCPYRHTAPVLTSYECNGQCRPRRRERATSHDERQRIDEIADRELPYWVPGTLFDETREMWRGVHRDHGITRVRDFWTPRNLWALASLWTKASECDERLCRALRFLLTSAILNTSKMQRFNFGRRGNGALTGTLYIGSYSTETNVLSTLGRKFDDILAGTTEQARFKGTAAVSLGSAARLNIPTASIDYIFTDPPFGSNIFYADCSLLWEAWLGELTDEQQEAVWNKSKTPEEGGKTLDQYGVLMERSFAEMYRVLKPGRWATVVFSNSDDRVWQAIQTAAHKAGFLVAGAGTLDKMQRSFKGNKGDAGEEKVVTKDVVMNLLKPVEGAPMKLGAIISDPEEHVRDLIHIYLSELALIESASGSMRSTQALCDRVTTTLLTTGTPTTGFGQGFIQSVLQASFKQVDGLWYRRGDRVRTDTPGLGIYIADETSAILWLDYRLSAAPATEAEIIPEFNTASTTVRLAGGLSRLLRENFIYDARTHRWRVPTPLERDALNDAGADKRRRNITRAATSSDDATPVEVLQLAEEAVKLEMYVEAKELLQRVHLPDLDAADHERALLLRTVSDAYLRDADGAS